MSKREKQCKDCIHSVICDELEEFRDPLWFINTEEEFVCSYYTAEDVVPRSEVEVWINEVMDLKDDYSSLYKEINQSKQEVAREILGEIEKNLVTIDDVDFNRFRCIGARTFAELKKKYIGV